MKRRAKWCREYPCSLKCSSYIHRVAVRYLAMWEEELKHKYAFVGEYYDIASQAAAAGRLRMKYRIHACVADIGGQHT